MYNLDVKFIVADGTADQGWRAVSEPDEVARYAVHATSIELARERA
jgi:hypothetical protein